MIGQPRNLSIPEGSMFQLTDLHGVARDVLEEAKRQDQKWGANRDLPDFQWLAILTEEVGESAQAALQSEFGGPHAGTTREELIQVAAVALQWIANIDRRESEVRS